MLRLGRSVMRDYERQGRAFVRPPASGPCPIMPAGPAVPGFPAPMPASRAKRPTRLLATYTRQALPGDLTAITLCHEHWRCLTIRTA